MSKQTDLQEIQRLTENAAIDIDWLHIRINTLLPHCRFQPPTWLTETLVELLDAYEACGGQLPHFKSALLVIEEYSDVDGRHIFDQDNKGWKAVSNAIKGRVIPDDDQYTLSVALLSTRSCQNVCHVTVLDIVFSPLLPTRFSMLLFLSAAAEKLPSTGSQQF